MTLSANMPAQEMAASAAVAQQRAAGVRARQQSRFAHIYLIGFGLSLLLCWSPINTLAYLTPWLVLALLIGAARSGIVARRLTLILAAWGIFLILHMPLVPDFAFPSAAISILTYGSIIAVVAIPGKALAGDMLYRQMLLVSKWFIAVEAVLGIGQAIYGYRLTGSFDMGNGDFVEGTIHPQPAAESAFSNPMFAVNMAFLLLFVLPSLLTRDPKPRRTDFVVYGLGLFALILASVVHVLLFLFVAGAIAAVIYAPNLVLRKRGLLILFGVALAASLSFVVLRSNFGTTRAFIENTLAGQTPRSQVVERAVVTMTDEYPFMTWIGLGPGQFSSRAGLIGTGMYFGTPRNPKPLPLIPVGMSKPFADHVLDLWLFVSFNNTGNNTSSTYKPYFSWLSVWVEFGTLFIVALLAVVGFLTLQVRYRYRRFQEQVLALSFGTGVFLILLLGIQENYWEVAQAIWPGLMMLKVMYVRLRRGRSINAVTASTSVGAGA